jgi:hypothetical protein
MHLHEFLSYENEHTSYIEFDGCKVHKSRVLSLIQSRNGSLTTDRIRRVRGETIFTLIDNEPLETDSSITVTDVLLSFQL